MICGSCGENFEITDFKYFLKVHNEKFKDFGELVCECCIDNELGNAYDSQFEGESVGGGNNDWIHNAQFERSKK